jgi:hypothetical protein
MDGYMGPAVLDLELTRSLATLERKFWSELHTPGADAPFVVRGPTYLKDKKKVPAGLTQVGGVGRVGWMQQGG